MRRYRVVGRATAVALTVVATLSALAVHPASAAADSTVSAWQRTGRPERLIVLRPGTVDLVSRGTVTRRLYTGPSAVTLGWLAANTGPGWVSAESGARSTVRVRAAVLLAPGSSLKIGPETKNVLLAAGDTVASGTWIRGSRASLELRGTRLGSVGRNGQEESSDRPEHAVARPYVYMGSGGRLNITDSTVTGLGATSSARFSGVTWGNGSTGSAVGSSFVHNRTGLRLAGSTGVRLDQVTARDSGGDGVVLDGDTGTTVTGLTSQRNGRNGVTVGGTDDRTLTGLSTRDNHGLGVSATAQRRLRLVRTAAHADQRGGIRLVSCAGCTVDQTDVDGAPVALAVSGDRSRVTVRDARLAHGGTGIALAAGIRGASVEDGRVDGFDRGIAVAGSSVDVDGTAVSGSRTGVSVYGSARHVSLREVTVRSGRNGVAASGSTADVSLTGVRVSGASGKGLSSASPGLRVTGGSVSGATTAVDLGAPARLDTLSVTGALRGVHLAADVAASGVNLDVLAERKGIEADRGARIDLTDSRVRAPVALTGHGEARRHGQTRVSLPPFPWLGFAALVALVLAAALQTVHQVRHRNTPQPHVPSHVHNTA